jgi:RNA polymerase sigma-54 factor
MALEHRLELKMLQKLILTPQLQQAIKLLQMPQLELSQMLSEELVENPFLEEISEVSEKTEPLREEVRRDEAGQQEEPVSPLAADDAEVPLERLTGFSVDEYFDSRGADGRDLGYFSPDINPTQSLDQYVSHDTDMYDHLNWQLRFSDAHEDVKSAAELVIGNIDDNGYLQATEDDIAKYSDTSIETARDAIGLVQSFDPPGIGASNLKECLILQLNGLDLNGSLVEEIVSESLREVEKRKYQRLAQKHSCSVDEIKEAVKVIEGLEPKPGRGMSASQTVYIKPDVFVVWGEGDLRIVLNDDNIPNIRINNFYKKLLSNKNSLNKEEKDYLEERLRSAVWLLKSLDHRNKTIYRVTESILNFQRGFFLDGVSNMKPLNLKDVATDLGMHESTISRATANKYLACSHGLFNFRFFFSSAVRSSTGPISSTSVKEMIRKIVSEEDPRKPLSDQKIAEILKSLNISVARRTVAKYRDEMNIHSQSLRRKVD